MNDSETDLKDFLIQHRNWSRWGGADELGAINLVTPRKVRQAAGLIRTGQAISLSRPLATKPDRGNPRPATHFLRTNNQWFGQEGRILRYVFWHSIVLASLVGLLVMLMAYVEPFKSLVVVAH